MFSHKEFADAWQERFDPYYEMSTICQESGGSTYQQKTVPIRLKDINGKLVTFLIPALEFSNAKIQLILHDYRPFAAGYQQVGMYFALGVKGSYYSEYNFVQTVSINNGKPSCDPPVSVNDGFYNDKYLTEYWHKKFPNYDGYMEDTPQAGIGFDKFYELTLVGKVGGKWEAVTTLTWGYTSVNDVSSVLPITQDINPSPTHIKDVNDALNFYNQ